MNNRIKFDALAGMIIGDAFGKMYFGKSREQLLKEDIKDFSSDWDKIIWSDKTSLALCVAEAIKDRFDKNRLLEFFDTCLKKNHWAVVGKEKFISKAIERNLKEAISRSGGFDIENKGTDQAGEILLQVVPLSFYTANMPLSLRYTLVRELVSLTAPDLPSLLAAFYLEEYITYFLKGDSLLSAYYTMQETFPLILRNMGFNNQDIDLLWRLLFREIWIYDMQEIGLYNDVISVTESALWAVINSSSFVDALVKAIKLGGDTVLLGALTGSLAGIVYSADNIPKNWLEKIYNRHMIEDLIESVY